MRTFKITAFLALALVLITSCNKPDDGPGPQPPSQGGQQPLIGYEGYFVYTNPDSPLLLEAKNDAGDLIKYYGDKDSEGKAMNCNLVSVKMKNGSDNILIRIDELGRPSYVTDESGASLSFEWITDEDLRIKAVSADGKAVVSIPFSTSQSSDDNSSKIHSVKERITSSKRISAKVLSWNEKHAESSLKNEKLTISLDRCDAPFNEGFVGLNVIPDKGDPLFYQSSVSNVNGQFNFDIPTGPSEKKVSDVCQSIEGVLDPLCTWAAPFTSSPGNDITICTALSAAMDFAILGPTGEGAYIFAGCETIINAFNIYCSTLGASPAPGTNSLLKEICNLGKKEVVASTYVFEPRVFVDGEGVVILDKTDPYPVSSSFPQLEYTLPSNPRIGDFTASPFDPAPGQDYTASANIYCATQGTIARISVTGSDGYEDSVSLELPAGYSKIVLDVPGADANVLDVLKIEAEDIGTLHASIVF